MKVLILCGGKGLRMKELTEDGPKPLARIGNKPMLWHIMKTYYAYGFKDFVLLLGYKGDKVKEYFMDYEWKNSSFVLNEDGSYEIFKQPEKWSITFLDTGLETMTGGRIAKAKDIVGDEPFMLTYGDGLADINLNDLLKFHKDSGKIATVTGIQKQNQYGVLRVEDHIAVDFIEKPPSKDIINGGFFVCNKEIFNYVKDDEDCIFEREPMVGLAKDKQLAVYEHKGFWTAIDTYKDITDANSIWNKNEALWRVW